MMRIGEKGKAYGLIKPNALKAPTLKPSVFGNDDDDEDNDVNAQLREVSRKKQKQAEAEQARLQKEDPSVYDYDGVYEKMQATKQQAVPVKQPEKKSKYIGALMEKAKIREREWAYDAKLQRERKNEDETYMGKEKFVTSAYKKKLQEDQMWKAEEARKAALEEDVTKKKDLGSFYKNLLDGNEAYGGIKEEEKKPKDERKDGGRKGKEGEKKDREGERGDREDETGDGDSKNKDSEEDKDTDRENKKRSRDDEKENGTKSESGDKGKKIKAEIKEESKEEGTKEETKEEDKEKEKEKESEKEREAKVPPKKLDEDAVSAARLRYLQRKGLA